MTLAADNTVNDKALNHPVDATNYNAQVTSTAMPATKNNPALKQKAASEQTHVGINKSVKAQSLKATSSDSATTPNYPLHIILVTETWFPDVNGVSMSLGKLMSEIVQLGHKVSLIRPQAKGLYGDKTANSIFANKNTDESITAKNNVSQRINASITKEICVHGVPIPRYTNLQFGMPQYHLIKRELKAMQSSDTPADIVHIATEGPLGLATLTVAKRLNIPVTTGYHTQFHDFSRHFGMGVIAKPMMQYFKWFHNWSDATCVPSQKTQDDLSELGFERIFQVGRGVDTEQFNPSRRNDKLRESWGVDNQHTVLIMVSRLSPEKGVDMVIEAYRALQTAQINRATKLVIVGEGPDRTRLEALAAPCGNDVIFTGAKLGIELAEYYASGDAFVFASQVETFGNVVIEAMASGVPVYAFNDAAAGMLVTPQTGALAPMGQSDAFIDMITHLPKMKQLNIQGQHARQAVAQFSWIRPAKQMLQMFEVAIAQHKHSLETVNSGSDDDIKYNNPKLRPIPQKSWLHLLTGH